MTDFTFLYPLAGASLGLLIGSFLATIVVRWPLGLSVVKGRSKCDTCNQRLSFWQLVPVISFAIQRGRCAHCGAPINKDHLLIELGSALIGALAMLVQPNMIGITGALFGWILLALAALDAKHHWLPDRLTFVLAVVGIASTFISPSPTFIDRIIGGISGYCALYTIAFIYRIARKREGMGGGDPKLFGAVGCWLGWSALPYVLLGASLVGLFAVATMQIRKQKIYADTMLPLGSFLAVSAFPVWLFQNAVL